MLANLSTMSDRNALHELTLVQVLSCEVQRCWETQSGLNSEWSKLSDIFLLMKWVVRGPDRIQGFDCCPLHISSEHGEDLSHRPRKEDAQSLSVGIIIIRIRIIVSGPCMEP